jgi:hypothetical protein
VITPTLGSIVQKGKLAACALAFDKQLKSVDFPTFGKPTIPHCKPIFQSIKLLNEQLIGLKAANEVNLNQPYKRN